MKGSEGYLKIATLAGTSNNEGRQIIIGTFREPLYGLEASMCRASCCCTRQILHSVCLFAPIQYLKFKLELKNK